jgi:hypothetical protein
MDSMYITYELKMCESTDKELQSDRVAVLEITVATQAMSFSPLLGRVSVEPSFPDDGKVGDVYLSSGSWMCQAVMHVFTTQDKSTNKENAMPYRDDRIGTCT